MSGAIEGYVAGTLPEAELEAFEEHLISCARCREEVRLAAALRDSFRAETTEDAGVDRATWSRIAWVATGAAAAAIGGLLILSPFGSSNGVPADSVHRDAPGALETVGKFEAVRPIDGALIDPGGLTLEWRSAAPEALYRVTLTDEQGDLVWQDSTRDTLSVIPAPVVGSGLYFWYVDARLEDGRTATTGAQTFMVK